MEKFVKVEMGFEVHNAKTKKKIRRSVTSKGYETESLGQKINKEAVEYFIEPLETALIRHELYQEYWEDFQCKINDFEDSHASQLIQQVINFVESNIPKVEPTGSKCEIPIGFVVTGEDKKVMKMIVEELDSCMPVDIALSRISSTKCPNVKSAFQNVAKQLVYRNPKASGFVGGTQLENEDEWMNDSVDDDCYNEKRYLTLHDVNNWYNSPKAAPYVVIIVEDVDLCPDYVVRDLLILFNCFKFPFTVLLGLISEFTPLTNFLSHDLSALCTIQKFTPVNTTASLENFFEIVYDLRTPLRLSGRIVQQLRTYFLHYHFSITRLLQLYQLCLMEHFKKPESIFCQKNLEKFWNSDYFLDIPEQLFLASVSSVPEFSKMGKCTKKSSPMKSPKKKEKLMNANKFEETKAETFFKLKKCYHDILEWYESFLFMFQFRQGIPDSSIVKEKIDLYIAVSTGTFFTENEKVDTPMSPFDILISVIKNLSGVELEKRLQAAYHEIQDFHKCNASSELVEFRLTKGIPFQIMNFISNLHKAFEQDERGEMNKSIVETKEKVPSTKLIFPSTRRSLKASSQTTLTAVSAKIAKSMEEQRGRLPAFSKARELIVNFIKTTIRSRLNEMTQIPCSQVYVFDDMDFITKQLFPNVSKEIHVALSQPHKYLNCDCCRDTTIESNHEHLPDVSIIYKLLLEQNHHTIDLNHLFAAFKSFHQSNLPKGRGSLALKKAKEEEGSLILRFGQACSELQFLGFLQSKKQKLDESTKLCWLFS